MQLYYHPISPYARKVLFAAYEKDVSFESVIVPPADWQRQAAAMRNVFPLGMTPTLVADDGTVIPESSIIIEHFDLKCAGPRFVPPDAGLALPVRMYDRLIDAYLIAPAGQLVFEARKPAAAQSASKRDALQTRVRTTLEFLERRLSSSPFLNGELPLLSDLAGCAGLAILDQLQFPVGDFSRVRGWYSALASRSSWQRILEQTRSLPNA